MKKRTISLICGSVFAFVSFFMGENLLFCIIMGIVTGIISYIIDKFIQQKKQKEVNRSYEMDLPDFLVHIAMFTETGMCLQDAIERAAISGEKNKLLYEDILNVFEKVRKGNTADFITGLEELADYRKIPSLSNFCITVVQNMRKGSEELSQLFITQAQLYRNERRRVAGKMADEAATLLIFPSAIVLVALIVLLIAPAVLDIFRGM